MLREEEWKAPDHAGVDLPFHRRLAGGARSVSKLSIARAHGESVHGVARWEDGQGGALLVAKHVVTAEHDIVTTRDPVCVVGGATANAVILSETRRASQGASQCQSRGSCHSARAMSQTTRSPRRSRGEAARRRRQSGSWNAQSCSTRMPADVGRRRRPASAGQAGAAAVARAFAAGARRRTATCVRCGLKYRGFQDATATGARRRRRRAVADVGGVHMGSPASARAASAAPRRRHRAHPSRWPAKKAELTRLARSGRPQNWRVR